jgi:hypothetical protein
MQKETITRIKLTASEGHVLTNGENYGKVAYLAQGDEGNGWYEITDEEYAAIMAQKEKESREAFERSN